MPQRELKVGDRVQVDFGVSGVLLVMATVVETPIFARKLGRYNIEILIDRGGITTVVEKVSYEYLKLQE